MNFEDGLEISVWALECLPHRELARCRAVGAPHCVKEKA